MKTVITLSLLTLSNVFMTLAWYSHLKFKEMGKLESLGMPAIILLSWGIAFFEYCLQVPANRIGYTDNGGPFNLWQLKVIQEILNLLVFTFFAVLFFKNETLKWNHLVAFFFLVLAVYFIFKK